MNSKAILGLIVLAGLIATAGGYYVGIVRKPADTSPEPTTPGETVPTVSLRPTNTQPPVTPVTVLQPAFQNIKSPHYVSSTPTNNAVVPTPVTTVAIRFNFDVAPPSKITVTRDGTEITTGATSISSDKLTLSVPIMGNQSGQYAVSYVACWPDTSCHNGSFGFAVTLP